MKTKTLMRIVSIICLFALLFTTFAVGTVGVFADNEEQASVDTIDEIVIDNDIESEADLDFDIELEAQDSTDYAILTGNKYSAGYKSWIQGADATVPVELKAGADATVVEDLCSGVDSNTPYTRAKDGDKGNGYHLQGGWDAGPAVIVYDLGEIQPIGRVDICNCPDSANAKSIANVKVEVSNDKAVWTEVYNQAAPAFDAWAASWDAQLITAKFTAINAQYVRVTASRANYCTRVSEIAVSGPVASHFDLQKWIAKAEEKLAQRVTYKKATVLPLEATYATYKDMTEGEFNALPVADQKAALTAFADGIAGLRNASLTLYTNNSYSDASKTWLNTQSGGTAVLENGGGEKLVPVNITTGKGIPDNQLANLTDGNATGSTAYGNWNEEPEFYFDLGSAKPVCHVDFVHSANQNGSSWKALKSIEVYVSDSATDWGSPVTTYTPATDIADEQPAGNIHRYLGIDFDEATGRYVKIKCIRKSTQILASEVGIAGPAPIDAVKAKFFGAIDNLVTYYAMKDKFTNTGMLETAYGKYANYTDEDFMALYDEEVDSDIAEINASISALAVDPAKLVILSNNQYSASYKSWIQGVDANAPVTPVSSTPVPVLTELCSGVAAYTPYTRANDGEKGSGYHLEGIWTGGPTVVTYDLGETQFISRVDICNSPDSANARSLGAIKVEVSDDLQAWTTIKEFTAPPFTEYEPPEGGGYKWDYQLVTSDLPLTSARYVRVSAARGSNCARVSEIAISGLPSPVNKFNQVKAEAAEYMEFEAYYTAESFAQLKTDYQTAAAIADPKSANPATLTALTEALQADMAALVAAPGQVILSGNAPLEDASRTWLLSQDPNAVVTSGNNTSAMIESSKSFDANQPPNTIDGKVTGAGNLGVAWTNYATKNIQITYTLGSTKVINRVDYVAVGGNRGDVPRNWDITSLLVETSVDGSNWETVANIDPPAHHNQSTAWEAQLCTVNFKATKAQYVRISVTDTEVQPLVGEIMISGYKDAKDIFTDALAKASAYVGYEGAYTAESFATFKAAYDVAAAIDVNIATDSEMLLAASALTEAAKGLEFVERGVEIISGQTLTASSVEWLQSKGYDGPTESATNPLATYVVTGADDPGNIADGKTSDGAPACGNWPDRASRSDYGYDLGGVYPVSRVDFVLNCHTDTIGNYQISKLTIQLSEDNQSWTTYEITDVPMITGKNIDELIQFELPEVKFARYVKAFGTKAPGGQAVNCKELIVSGFADVEDRFSRVMAKAQPLYQNESFFTPESFAQFKIDYEAALAVTTKTDKQTYYEKLTDDMDALVYKPTSILTGQNFSDADKTKIEGFGITLPTDVAESMATCIVDPSDTGSNNPGNLIDGNLSTISWGWYDHNAIYRIDLGGKEYVNRVDYIYGNADHPEYTKKINQFKVEVSDDAQTWTQVALTANIPELPNENNAMNGITLNFDLVKARYIRVTMTSAGHQAVTNEIIVSGYHVIPTALIKAMASVEYYTGAEVKTHFTTESMAVLDAAVAAANAYLADDTQWNVDTTAELTAALSEAVKNLKSEDYIVISGNNIPDDKVESFYTNNNKFNDFKYPKKKATYTYDRTIGSGLEGDFDPECTKLGEGITFGHEVWCVYNSGNPITAVWDLKGTYMVSSVDVVQNDGSQGSFTSGRGIGDIKVEYSMDGTAWSTAATGTGNTSMDGAVFDVGGTRYMNVSTVNFTPVKAKYIRISTSKLASTPQQRLDEHIIYGWRFGANKDDLDTLIESLGDRSFLNIATDETKAAFEAAYQTATEVSEDDNATQEQVDNAKAALDAAVAGLKYKGSEYALTNNVSTSRAMSIYGDLTGYNLGVTYEYTEDSDEQAVGADLEFKKLTDNSIGGLGGNTAIWSDWFGQKDVVAIFDTGVEYSYITGIDLFDGVIKLVDEEGNVTYSAPYLGGIKVYLSNDKTNWTELGADTAPVEVGEVMSDTINTERMFTVDTAQPLKARYIKVVATKAGSKNNYCLNEVVVRGYLPSSVTGEAIKVTSTTVNYYQNGVEIPTRVGADEMIIQSTLLNESPNDVSGVWFTTIKNNNLLDRFEFVPEDNSVSIPAGQSAETFVIISDLDNISMTADTVIENYIWSSFDTIVPLGKVDIVSK